MKLQWIILGPVLSKKSKISQNLNFSLITQQVADKMEKKVPTFRRLENIDKVINCTFEENVYHKHFSHTLSQFFKYGWAKFRDV